MKIVVLAIDAAGDPVVIGPVYSEESAARIQRVVEARGWTNRGTAAVESVDSFYRHAPVVTG